ncbi:putative PPE family protein PPE38 [Mycobacterium mantenii]|uniref:PPE family protein n=1 Tax=Mycobacterium mantenii TaxID=560555 RepID=A0A1X0FTI5_MYCNT|nr:PPE family protein [Mycobacterium mantenii]MCV7246222.1 PPE family protein [Mycobacterium mantenii]ORB05087.1 PPE family protein [Mycobacterium mantenii]BBY37901.1 putative PPE family protein PPE38 [Mycobacterium mantenii]
MIPSFVFFPPEINSALIFGGAGAGPLFEAASAWDGLAVELSTSASSFQTVISDLVGGAWMGPSSISMTVAAAPYLQWLVIAAAQAEVAALQARIAALAFEGAVVATVPLPAVLANRARLLVLIATNFLGINTAAIAQTELEYLEMWAQDVAAMLGYHAGAQSMAQALPEFSVPPPAPSGGGASAGLAGLADLVTAPLNFASQFFQGLSSLGTAFVTELQPLLSVFSPAVSLLSSTPVATLTTVAQAGMYPAAALMTPMVTLAHSPGPAAPAASAPLTAPTLVGVTSPPLNSSHSTGSALSDLQPLAGGGLGALGIATAGLGSARFIGSMSVPAAWEGSMPAYIATPAMSGVGSGAPAAAAAASGSGVPVAAMPVGEKNTEGEDRGTKAEVVRSRPKVVPRNRPG